MIPDITGMHKTNPSIRYPTNATPIIIRSGHTIEWRRDCELAGDIFVDCLNLILRRSRTGMVWFYTSTSNKRPARPKLYTKSLTRDLKLMYSRLTLVRISINL